VLLTFAILLAACGSSTAPATRVSATATVGGDYVGAADNNTYVALSTDGTRALFYAADGVPRTAAGPPHFVTFALWISAAVTGASVDVITQQKAHLAVTFTAMTASGSLSLPASSQFPYPRAYVFSATLAPHSGVAGLYRSEHTINGVRYLGGWIVFSPLPGAAMGLAGGGLLNEQTAVALDTPAPDLALRRVVVPGIGTFPLTRCAQATCG
jgi:hypothetical protein